MEFKVFKVSSCSYKPEEITSISTIEELESLYKKYGRHSLIVDFEAAAIHVYDDYIE